MKFVCELPDEVQAEIRQDAINTMRQHTCCDESEIMETVEYIMNEKLINIIGDEEGMLNPEKYYKYLNM